MLGGIYTTQKCPVCGEGMRDNGRWGVTCPAHPDQEATKLIVKFGKVWKRFRSYEAAQRFLTGLRFKVDEGSFDSRDYRRENPLGFVTLAEKWLENKREAVRPGTYKGLRNYTRRAIAFFGARNVKDLGFGDLEDFVRAQAVSDKTRANMIWALKDFWRWILRRQVITPAQMPVFPEIRYELNYRRTVDKKTQEAIIGEVERIASDRRIGLAIRWLATYVSIRPAELLALKEGDIDLVNGYLFIPHPKEKRPKRVPLLEEDMELLKSLPRGLPGMYFFRHERNAGKAKRGEPFRPTLLWKWWKRACANLGVEGVDLYGGTRHSSALALRAEGCTPEEIRRATMHATNRAFERYYRIEADEIRAVYRKTQAARRTPAAGLQPVATGLQSGATKMQPDFEGGQKCKLLILKE